MTQRPWTELVKYAGKWGARHYALPDDTMVPSVTTILQVVNKPALVPWAARTERELAIKTATQLYADMVNTGQQLAPVMFAPALEERIGKQRAFEREREKSQDIGTHAHKLAEWWIRKSLGQIAREPLGGAPEALQAFKEFQDWWDTSTIKPIVVEQAVWHPEEKYAGTMDILADWGGLGVFDLKASKAIYDEMFLQVAAYAKAVDAMGHGPVEHAGIIRIPKFPGDHIEIVTIRGPALEDAYKAFCAFHRGFQWLESRKPEVKK